MATVRVQTQAGRQTWLIDVAFVVAIAVVVYSVIALASNASTDSFPSQSNVTRSPSSLPLYAGLSIARMLAAYVLAIIFSLVYGYIAAHNERAGSFMVPILDILQSIPILSFMPMVVLAMIAIFQQSRIGIELAAVSLIFTSQAWNLTFSFYH